MLKREQQKDIIPAKGESDMTKFEIALVGTALFMAGCATTSSPDDLGKLEYTGFSTKSDGSAYQSVMGLTCPTEIDGIQRTSTKVYNDRGTDVGCNYSDDDQIFTVYLGRFPSDDLTGYFRYSQSALEYTYDAKGYVYDEALSESCSSESIDAASIMSGFSGLLTGKNTSNTITISPAPSAVYINADAGKMSLVVVDEMYEKDFFKTRYTGAYRGADDVEKICKRVRENYLEMKSSTDKARGIQMSETDKLMGLMNSSGEGS